MKQREVLALKGVKVLRTNFVYLILCFTPLLTPLPAVVGKNVKLAYFLSFMLAGIQEKV